MNRCVMVQWQRGRNEAEKGKASRVMVKWVAVWQAAKKGLSHSPYVTCFPNASAVRICYQSAPADNLSVLNCSHFTMSPSLLFLPVTLFIFPHSLFPACVSCHMDVIADKRKLMHVESMAPDAQASINKKLPPTHMSIALLRLHSHVPECVCSLLGEGYRRNIVFVFETGLGSDV